MGLRSPLLLKQNIETLLRARGQHQKDLAQWCGLTKSWLNQILRDPYKPKQPGQKERGLPLRHLDKIADFFGLEPYQLFLPNISPMTERRKGLERRTGTERRQGRGSLIPTPMRSLQEALTVLVRQVEDEDVLRRMTATLDEQLRAQRLRQGRGIAPVAPASGARKPPASDQRGVTTRKSGRRAAGGSTRDASEG